jgi:YHS domain-containing protein
MNGEVYKQNNGILDKKNSDNGSTCALCGKKFEKNESIQEKIDGYEYLFNSEDCMGMFKKLAILYGDEFKASIGDEQHNSNPILASVMPMEKEFGKLKNNIDRTGNETFEIIKDPIQVQELAFKLASSSESEILGLFSTANAFHRQERMGMLPKLQEMRKNNDKLKIRILTPFDDDIRLISKKLRDEWDIEIMNLGEPSRIRASILLVDKKFVLYIELKDDTSYTSYEAIGPSLFSSIGSTVISYVTIFETMWRQQELYQQLSKFQKQIETYEQTNKQLNDTIDVLLSKMHKNWKT